MRLPRRGGSGDVIDRRGSGGGGMGIPLGIGGGGLGIGSVILIVGFMLLSRCATEGAHYVRCPQGGA